MASDLGTGERRLNELYSILNLSSQNILMSGTSVCSILVELSHLQAQLEAFSKTVNEQRTL
jgi:hypothetical protein